MTRLAVLKLAGIWTLASLLTAAFAIAAHGREVCHYGDPGTTVSIAPHDEAWAEVTIHNRLAQRLVSVCTLTLDDREVVVEYDPRPFNDPDWFTVEAPEGYVAVPWRVLLEDNSRSSVLIYEQVGM